MVCDAAEGEEGEWKVAPLGRAADVLKVRLSRESAGQVAGDLRRGCAEAILTDLEVI